MAKSATGKKSILVVDDDEDLIFLLSTKLKKSGYNVQYCIGGVGLMDILLKFKPFLLLLDISMQAENGAELCQEIKKIPVLKNTKIILMSGNYNIAEHAAACDADDYISKPLSLDLINSTVMKHMV